MELVRDLERPGTQTTAGLSSGIHPVSINGLIVVELQAVSRDVVTHHRHRQPHELDDCRWRQSAHHTTQWEQAVDFPHAVSQKLDATNLSASAPPIR